MLVITNSVLLLLSTAAFTLALDSSKSDDVPIPGLRTNDSATDVETTAAPPKPTSTTLSPPTSTTLSPTTIPTTSPTTIPTTHPTTHPTTAPTTPVPTTPVPTTPVPAPTTPPTNDWVVDHNGTVCIIANMGIKVNVPYNTTVDNKTGDAEFKIEKLVDAVASGTCGETSQTLVLTHKNFTATFNFVQNITLNTYWLSTIELKIDVNNYTFPNNSMVNVTSITLKHENQVFSVPVNHSYTCASVTPLSLDGTTMNGSVALNETVTGSISVSNAHVEAFGTGKEAKFSEAMDCAGTQTPDIVPIAVGLILAGLVIVVLVAYLVGRRRAQARGYLSM